MKKGKKLNPVVLIFVCIVIAFKLLNLGFLYSKVIITGGETDINNLVAAYQHALNNEDVDEYMRLVPACERTREEKKYIRDHLKEYSGKDYNMVVVEKKQEGIERAGEESVQLFFMNPMFSPIVNEVYSVKVRVEDTDVRVFDLDVYRCGKKYFINDVDVY